MTRRVCARPGKEHIVKKEHLLIVAAVLLGAMASGKILSLPLLNKLPRF